MFRLFLATVFPTSMAYSVFVRAGRCLKLKSGCIRSLHTSDKMHLCLIQNFNEED